MSYLHELAEAQRHAEAHQGDRRRAEWAEVRADIDTILQQYPENHCLGIVQAYRAGFARAAAQAVPRSPAAAPHPERCACAECLEAAEWAEDAERTRRDALADAQGPL